MAILNNWMIIDRSIIPNRTTSVSPTVLRPFLQTCSSGAPLTEVGVSAKCVRECVIALHDSPTLGLGPIGNSVWIQGVNQLNS